MKNIKYILIILFMLSFFSCGKKGDNIDNKQQNQNQQNQTQQNNLKDTSASNQEQKQIAENRKRMTEELTPEKKVTAVEAKDYVGKVVTVTGYIADVYKNDNVEYLNFVQKYPKNPFTGVIFKEKFGEFGDLDVFLHKEVELTGRVSLYKDKPQIIMKSKLQIIITK